MSPNIRYFSIFSGVLTSAQLCFSLTIIIIIWLDMVVFLTIPLLIVSIISFVMSLFTLIVRVLIYTAKVNEPLNKLECGYSMVLSALYVVSSYSLTVSVRTYIQAAGVFGFLAAIVCATGAVDRISYYFSNNTTCPTCNIPKNFPRNGQNYQQQIHSINNH